PVGVWGRSRHRGRGCWDKRYLSGTGRGTPLTGTLKFGGLGDCRRGDYCDRWFLFRSSLLGCIAIFREYPQRRLRAESRQTVVNMLPFRSAPSVLWIGMPASVFAPSVAAEGTKPHNGLACRHL